MPSLPETLLETLPDLPVSTAELAGLVGVFLVGGFVKGVAAFGLPLVTVSLGSFFLPVPVVLSVSAPPILLSNVLQVAQNGPYRDAARAFWPLLPALVVGILTGLQLIAVLAEDAVKMVVAVAIEVFVMSRVLGFRPHLRHPPRRQVLAATGVCSGLIAGVTSFVGFPLIPVMTAYGAPRRTFALVVGAVFVVASATLSGGLAVLGLLGPGELLASALLLPPLAVGQVVGTRVRDSLPEDRVRQVIVTLLGIAGAALFVQSARGLL